MTTELDKYKRMFQSACMALGEVGDALGCDPSEGGSEPILDAIAELKSSRDESDGVRDILSKHLAGIAIALKGPELALHRHGYHDLEEKAQVAMLEIELLKHENQRLTGEAKVMRDLLTKARDVIEVVIKDGEMESDEGYQMAQLSGAMAKAVGMPLDVQFLPADDTEGGSI